MSRNKTIKAMHEMTGLPYSICRKKLKENHWNLSYAMGFDQLGKFIDEFNKELCNRVIPVIEAVANATSELVNKMIEFFSNIDWQEIKEQIDELNRQNNLETLPVEISTKTIGTEAESDL